MGSLPLWNISQQFLFSRWRLCDFRLNIKWVYKSKNREMNQLQIIHDTNWDHKDNKYIHILYNDFFFKIVNRNLQFVCRLFMALSTFSQKKREKEKKILNPTARLLTLNTLSKGMMGYVPGAVSHLEHGSLRFSQFIKRRFSSRHLNDGATKRPNVCRLAVPSGTLVYDFRSHVL